MSVMVGPAGPFVWTEALLVSLFGRESISNDDILVSSDAGTRALSVAVVENDFVERVYGNQSSWYDLFFGPTLHAGRLDAIRRIAIQPGEQVLEVGVGTAINATLYPHNCSVTGIDFSAPMLEKAARRLKRHDVRNQRLMQMDAADLRFPDESFGRRVCVVRHQRRAGSRAGGTRDASGVPHRRTHHLLESLPQRESGALADRAPALAAHRSRRVQVRPRPAGLPGTSRTAAGVDRQGQPTAALVAGEVR